MDNEKLTALVKRVKNGNPDAMNGIFDATSAPIFYYCEKVLASKDADSVVSSIYDYAEKNISALENDGEILRWLRLISAKFCAEKLGLTGKTEDFDVSAADGIPTIDEVAPEDIMNPAVYDSKIKHAVPQMLEDLGPNDRFCAYTYYYYSFSESAIASILGVDEEGVKARLKIVRFGIKTNVGFYSNLSEADAEGLYFSRQLIQSFIFSDAMNLKSDEPVGRPVAPASITGGDPNRFRKREETSARSTEPPVAAKNPPRRQHEKNPVKEHVHTDRKYQEEIAAVTYVPEDETKKKNNANYKKLIFILAIVVAVILLAAAIALLIIKSVGTPDETTESTETTEIVITDTLNSISFATEEITKKVGDVFTLDVIFDPENITDKSLVWRSHDPEIASVDENTGEITILKPGKTVVIAASLRYQDYSENPEGELIVARCTIDAYEEPEVVIENMFVDNVSAGEFADIGLKITPEESAYVVELVSGDDSIVTIDEFGRVKALKEGLTTVTAVNKFTQDEYASCIIIVSGRIADSFELESESMELTVGDTAKIGYVTSPEGSIFKDMKFEISEEGNPEAIQIDENGYVTAVSPGIAAVVVYSETLSLESARVCTVIVKENKPFYPDLESIVLSDKKIIICVGENKKLTAEFIPEGVENKALVWQSQDASVASIDGNGNVTAVSPGVTFVAAATYYTDADGNPIMAQCEVVVYIEASSVKETDGRSALTMAIGEVTYVSADVSPEKSREFLQYVSSNESVATIDNLGKVTAISEGIAAIYVKNIYSGKTDPFCVVNVSGRLATGFTLEYGAAELTLGEMFQIRVRCTPTGAVLRDLKYQSQDTSIATVDANGLVTTVGAGVTTIAVYSEYLMTTSSDPSSTVCSVTINVSEPVTTIPVTALQLIEPVQQCSVGAFITLNPVLVVPSKVTNARIKYESKNPDILEVIIPDIGSARAKKAGIAEVIISSVSNPEVTAKLTVIVS